MKKFIPILFLALACLANAQSPTNVQKGGFAGSNNLTGSFNVGPGVTVTILSGGSLVANAGSTITGIGGGLPDQTGNSGKFLTTNGTAASWATTGDMVLASVQTVTGAKTFNSSKLILAGSTSGTTILNANATAGSGTVVLPLTGTLATLDGAEALTNKTVNGQTITAGSGTLTLGSVTLNAGAGGTLGSNAFTSTAYAPLASPTFTGTVTIPTPFTLGAVSVLPTGTELNFVDGVTSSIQTQLDAKSPLASPTFTGTVTFPTPFTLGATSVTTTGAQLNFVAGVTSAIQTQLDAKQSTITFGTNVQAALGNTIGTAGAPVLFNGAGGIPSSLTLTNATGYAVQATSGVFGVVRVDGTTITASGGIISAVGGGGTWGSITGTLSNQTDLQTALNLKAPLSSPSFTTPNIGAAQGTTLALSATTSLLLGTQGSAIGNIGFRNATSGTITLAPVSGALGTVTLSLPAANDTLVGKATTDTLTNKRITARVAPLTDAGTVTPATDSFDGGVLTSLSQSTAFAIPTGTPTDGQRYFIRIKSSTARTLSWSSSTGGYRGSADLALPLTTSGSSLTDYIIFSYNAADSKWDILGRNMGF